MIEYPPDDDYARLLAISILLTVAVLAWIVLAALI